MREFERLILLQVMDALGKIIYSKWIISKKVLGFAVMASVTH